MGGAMLLPMLASVAGSLLAPQPEATVIAPPPAVPNLTADNAAQIGAATAAEGQTFGNQMLNNILSKARSQGTNEKALGSIQNEFHDWLGKNSDEITKSLGIMAANSQAQADYINTVNQNNTNAQVQALQSQQGGGGLFGSLLKGLGGMGGMGGGDMFSAPADVFGGAIGGAAGGLL